MFLDQLVLYRSPTIFGLQIGLRARPDEGMKDVPVWISLRVLILIWVPCLVSCVLSLRSSSGDYNRRLMILHRAHGYVSSHYVRCPNLPLYSQVYLLFS